LPSVSDEKRYKLTAYGSGRSSEKNAPIYVQAFGFNILVHFDTPFMLDI